MSKQIENYCPDHCCACFDDDIVELQTENAKLREAAEHYFHCRTCAEDSVFSCPVGYKYGRLLDFISPDEKAV